jgi:hypothetical protein
MRFCVVGNFQNYPLPDGMCWLSGLIFTMGSIEVASLLVHFNDPLCEQVTGSLTGISLSGWPFTCVCAAGAAVACRVYAEGSLA